MDPTIRDIEVEFYNIANDLFQSTYQEFRNDAALIDRNGDENVYQLLRSKYSKILRQLLEQRAGLLIDRVETKEKRLHLGASLAETIHYFDVEFMRKADEAWL